MLRKSNQTPKEPSSRPRKSNIDYSVDNTPEAQARYMEMVKNYPKEVATDRAKILGKVPPEDSEK